MKSRHIIILAALVLLLSSCSKGTVTVQTAQAPPVSQTAQHIDMPTPSPDPMPIVTTATEEPSPVITPEPVYCLIVDKEDNAFGVFECDENGEPKTLVKTFPCALGKSSRMTPTGTFHTDKKYRWKEWTDNRYGKYSPYATYYDYVNNENYKGGLYIHGPTFTEKSGDTLYTKSYEEIGENKTSGCIRTTTEGAYWVYTYCPKGTVIKIVSSSDLVSWPGLPEIDPKYPKWDPTDPDKPN